MEQVKPTLIIMAAGMGSRFGGLKQISPVGPAGEKIIDYSVYDAIHAGFGKVVFVIKHAIEEEFKAQIGDTVARHVPVSYVYQELDALPDGYTVPEGRQKPWGTGHAVLCCRDIVREPFAVINADDYYGRTCFKLLAEHLARPQHDAPLHFAMAGYRLCNTLTENGYVSRGICTVEPDGRLTALTERTHIELRDGAPMFTEDDAALAGHLRVDELLGLPRRDARSFLLAFLRVPRRPRTGAQERILPPLRRRRHGREGRGGCARTAHTGQVVRHDLRRRSRDGARRTGRNDEKRDVSGTPLGLSG